MDMDAKIEKILGLIQTLPADQVVIIADKCRTMSDISPRVQKIIELVKKLNEKEHAQFLTAIKEIEDGCNMEQLNASDDIVGTNS